MQAELERGKNKKGTRYSGVSIFSNKIKCGDCGNWFGSKVWHSTDKYRKIIYRCNHKYKDKKCQTPHVTEDEIKEMFVKAFNELLTEKKEIITNIEFMKKTIFDTSALVAERDKLQEEMTVIVDMTQNLIAENSRVAQDQEKYHKRYSGLVERYETLKKRYDELTYEIEQKDAKSEKMRQFIKVLKKQDKLITDFDEVLWSSLVEFVTIGRTERSVTFRDGDNCIKRNIYIFTQTSVWVFFCT